MCPPTSFSDHGTSASEKIRSTPRKTFFNSIDPEQHFATANYCIAKGSFDHPVEYLGHLEADLTKIDHRVYAGCGVVD
jgi:hypothetical protein